MRYNPFAAVPSLHFGYALLVGAAMALLAGRRSIRIAGAAYPVVMLFVIVATGNHFVFDAAAGAVVTVAGWLTARRLVDEKPRRAGARCPGPPPPPSRVRSPAEAPTRVRPERSGSAPCSRAGSCRP